MMDVSLLVQYRIVITPHEFRIIGQALRGALRDEWRAEALALQERMARERQRQADQLAREAQKTVDNINAAREEDDDAAS